MTPPVRRRNSRKHEKLFRKFKGKCFYCECRLVLPHDSLKADRRPHVITRDHLVPRSKGGNGAADNIVAACQRCNSKRGNRPWQDFLVETRRARGLDPVSPPTARPIQTQPMEPTCQTSSPPTTAN